MKKHREYRPKSPQVLANLLHDGRWKKARHLDKIEEKLIEIYNSNNDRVIVNMPPRHGKSELITKIFPLWWLINKPSDRIIISTYNSKLSEYFGREILDNFKRIASDYELALNNSQKSKSEFVTNKNGSITAVGVGGTLTGKGADLIIVDDPIKNDKEANSETRRESLMEWFNATLLTRLEPSGAVILVMTRWHEDDLAGRLLQSTGWDSLIFPAIATKPDELGRKVGDALWEERYSISDLLKKKQAIGQYWFAGLYQQEPTPSEGGLFNRDDLQYFENQNGTVTQNCKAIAQVNNIMFACDLAISTSDERKNLYLIDLYRDKIVPTRHKDIIAKLNRQYNPVLIGVETVQYQASLFYQLSELGLPVVKLVPRKDKLSRALPLSALVENGKLFINKQIDAIADLEKELVNFPNGNHDDIVDALAYAVEMMKRKSSMQPTGISTEKSEEFSLFR